VIPPLDEATSSNATESARQAVLGALIGHADTETRTTTGLVSGQRFGSLGLIIIGTQLNGKPDYLGPAIVFSLVDLILSVEIGRRATPTRADDPDPRNDPSRHGSHKTNGQPRFGGNESSALRPFESMEAQAGV
jgi:hypothetical protein